jgi:hypothetical protein
MAPYSGLSDIAGAPGWCHLVQRAGWFHRPHRRNRGTRRDCLDIARGQPGRHCRRAGAHGLGDRDWHRRSSPHPAVKRSRPDPSAGRSRVWFQRVDGAFGTLWRDRWRH